MHGMQFGEFGAHMAVNAPEREVMMLDPSPNNVRDAKKRYSVLKNVHILQGGLGVRLER
jgi:tRNA G46 methylase TrmB